MKKILSFTFFLALLFFVFQFFVILLYQGHEIKYNLKSKENIFGITENLFIENKKSIYQFQINWGDDIFLLENKTNYNKRKKVISDILWYEKDNTRCVYPVYQDSDTDVHDVMCVRDKSQYTYTALLAKDPSFTEFQKELIALGVTLPSWKGNDKTKDVSEMQVYASHIPNDTYLGIWKYQGLQLLTNDTDTYTSLLMSDSYQTKGVLVDEYYVIPNFDLTAEVNSILVAGVNSFGSREITFDFKISKDCYFNGVVEGKAYLFDRTNKKQYEIIPKSQSIREIGNIDINAQFYDGENWVEKNIYDFVSNKVVFGFDTSKIMELQKYKPSQVVETINSYYYSNNKGEVYRLYKKMMNNPILLFSSTNIVELKVVNDSVFFLSGDTLSFYHDTIGLRPLVIYNEFKFNTNDMYVVYQK